MRGSGQEVKRRLALDTGVTVRFRTTSCLRPAERVVTFSYFGQAKKCCIAGSRVQRTSWLWTRGRKDNVPAALRCLTQPRLFLGAKHLEDSRAARRATDGLDSDAELKKASPATFLRVQRGGLWWNGGISGTCRVVPRREEDWSQLGEPRCRQSWRERIGELPGPVPPIKPPH
jgi:hypothetical protein